METKKYYHATSFRNLYSILDEGIKPGCDGMVYLCDNPDGAAKFVAIRGMLDILVLEVNLVEEEVEESFDHSQAFFKERAFIYPRGILPCQIYMENARRYELDKSNL